MSIARHLALLFRVKATKALDRAEDPREVLDYCYQRQNEMLAKVGRGLADVATSRKRLELQQGQLQQSADRLEGQATEALGIGNQDLAREALTRRAAVLTKIQQVQPQRDALKAEEVKLVVAQQRLQAKVEAFRTPKETIKATYTPAEAETHINEAVSGISEEMGDVGLAMQRAEDKTTQMLSRAQALDELMDSGALDDATLPAGDATASKPPSTPPEPVPATSTVNWPDSRAGSAPLRCGPRSTPAQTPIAARSSPLQPLTRRPGRDHPHPRAMYAGFTIGGPATSMDGQVLGEDGSVIPGLYAAGACASSVAQDGKGYASGTQLGEGSFFGRRAGAHAAGVAQSG